MIPSKKRQIGVNPVLFDAIVYQTVWCSLAALPYKQSEKKTQNILSCFLRLQFSCCSRRFRTLLCRFRDEMKERVSIDFRGRRKVSAFKESTMNEMRWFDDAWEWKYLWCFFNRRVPGLIVVSWIRLQHHFDFWSIEIFRRHILDGSHINDPATQCLVEQMKSYKQNLVVYLFVNVLLRPCSACDISMTHKKYQKSFSIWINTDKGAKTRLSWPFPVAMYDAACCLPKDA